MSDKQFRGYWAIAEVVARMKKLAEHYAKFHPRKTICLYRKDYDLLARWPKAAALHGIRQEGKTLVFMGFELGYDKTEKRYAREIEVGAEMPSLEKAQSFCANHAAKEKAVV